MYKLHAAHALLPPQYQTLAVTYHESADGLPGDVAAPLRAASLTSACRSGRAAQPRARRAAVPARAPPVHPGPRRLLRALRRPRARRRRHLRLPRRTVRRLLPGNQRLYLISNKRRNYIFLCSRRWRNVKENIYVVRNGI